MESFEDVKRKHWSYNIVKEYKHLFADLFWGIECGSGWQKPITKLLESFEWNRTHNTHIDNPNYDIDKEIKESKKEEREKILLKVKDKEIFKNSIKKYLENSIKKILYDDEIINENENY